MTVEHSDHNSTEDGSQDKDLEMQMPVIDAANAEVDTADIDNPKAKFLNANGGKVIDDTDAQVVVEVSSSEISFTGMGKEDLLQYANDPFWVRFRLILFILFWVGWLAMLAAAIIIIILAPSCPSRPNLKWYEKEVVYQIDPTSFKDTSDEASDVGAGIGDLKGVHDKFSYIQELGSKILWLDSVLKSDEYGVLDFEKVDDKIGTIDDIRSMLKDMKKKEMKMVLELNPSQTSVNHTWFKKSKMGDEMYKDFYIWLDSPPAAPSNFGWQIDQNRGKSYLWKNSVYSPILNLKNKDVVTEIKRVMSSWLSTGVSGFSIRDAEHLTFDMSNGRPNVTGNVDVLTKFKAVAESFSDKPGRERMLFAMFPSTTNNESNAYLANDLAALHLIPSTALVEISNKADCLSECARTKIGSALNSVPEGQRLGWVLGSPYLTRLANRPNDERYDALMALQMLLPGTPFTYYGDEVGMKDSLDAKNMHRSPMQWNDGVNAGFSMYTPWTELAPEYETRNVAYMQAHFAKDSKIVTYQDLAKLREKEAMQWGRVKNLDVRGNLLWFMREADGFPGFLVIINMGSQNQLFMDDKGLLPKEGEVIYHSKNVANGETHNLKSGIALSGGVVVVYQLK